MYLDGDSRDQIKQIDSTVTDVSYIPVAFYCNVPGNKFLPILKLLLLSFSVKSVHTPRKFSSRDTLTSLTYGTSVGTKIVT